MIIIWLSSIWLPVDSSICNLSVEFSDFFHFNKTTNYVFMVDLCRPTTLSSNKSLGPNTANTSSINGNSNFFPSIFVRMTRSGDDVFIKHCDIFSHLFCSFLIRIWWILIGKIRSQQPWRLLLQLQRWNIHVLRKKNYVSKRKGKRIKVENVSDKFCFLARILTIVQLVTDCKMFFSRRKRFARS